MKDLVIVESPTKAKTLTGFLGNKYQIEASMGHIRDLPKSEIGVDVDKDFEPRYIIPKSKVKKNNELKKLLIDADNIWLATDPDREGEAIAWHISEIIKELKNKNKSSRKEFLSPSVKRVVFHEITIDAVKNSFDHPRQIDTKLVDAQQGRRILDRLVGYKLSPLLWKKVKSGLSAGRVQSVAVRLVVEKERDIKSFLPVEYWTIKVYLQSQDKSLFESNLIEKNNKKISIKTKEDSDTLVKDLFICEYKVLNISKKEIKRYPYPPFTTSTMQQAASNRLGMSAKKTMSLAQALYERGLITYMRTDSVNLSTQALTAIRDYIQKEIGSKYLPKSPNYYKTKSKMAQEAHEAIRPTKINLKQSDISKIEGLSNDHAKLYDLIWKRSLASQMNPGIVNQTTIDIVAKDNKIANDYKLRTVGSVLLFDGWGKIYGSDEKDIENEHQMLPELSIDESLDLNKIVPEQHFTEPPARYNDASLIKKLEELGIGRPSTYAPIISTIQDRYYVEKEDKKFIPTELGIAVTDFLKQYFPDIVDYQFTANLEEELDDIAQGERNWKNTLRDFYIPFEKKIEETFELAEHIKIESEHIDRSCPQCGKQLTIRYSKFGKFIACSGYPECKYTESLTGKINIPCPQCGGEIVARRTKKGRTFYGCKNWPSCKYASWNNPEEVKKKN